MSRIAILALVIVLVSLFVVWMAGSALRMPDSHAGQAQLFYQAAMAVALLTTLVLGWRGSLGQAFKYGATWFAAFFVLILAYSYRNDLAPLAERVSGELNPAKPVTQSPTEVTLRRAADGHFYADARINGREVRLLADTGASVIALTVEDAEDAGINVDQLDFDIQISTANGMAAAARVEIDSIRIGSIRRDNVTGLVGRGLTQSLLGMNFFNSLSKFQVEDEELRLTD